MEFVIVPAKHASHPQHTTEDSTVSKQTLPTSHTHILRHTLRDLTSHNQRSNKMASVRPMSLVGCVNSVCIILGERNTAHIMYYPKHGNYININFIIRFKYYAKKPFIRKINILVQLHLESF